MSNSEHYEPGPAREAQVKKEGDKWTLILVRELRHSPEKVWQALTDPAGWSAAYPGCSISNGDMNGSSTTDGDDVQMFAGGLMSP